MRNSRATTVQAYGSLSRPRTLIASISTGPSASQGKYSPHLVPADKVVDASPTGRSGLRHCPWRKPPEVMAYLKSNSAFTGDKDIEYFKNASRCAPLPRASFVKYKFIINSAQRRANKKPPTQHRYGYCNYGNLNLWQYLKPLPRGADDATLQVV